MGNHLDTKNLVPFSVRHNGFRLPGMRKDHDQEMLEQVDPDLQPEDEGMIRRYLHYADTLLGSPDEKHLTLVQGGGPAREMAGTPEVPIRFSVDAPKNESSSSHPEKDDHGPDDGKAA